MRQPESFPRGTWCRATFRSLLGANVNEWGETIAVAFSELIHTICIKLKCSQKSSSAFSEYLRFGTLELLQFEMSQVSPLFELQNNCCRFIDSGNIIYCTSERRQCRTSEKAESTLLS